MMPNLDIAEDRKECRIELFYDIGMKKYGIRERHEVIQDGVHIEASKSVVMTKEQLEKLIADAKDFIGTHGKA